MSRRGRKRKNDLLCFGHQKVTGLIPVATGVFRYHHCQLFNKTLCFGEGDTKGERERERERESEMKLRERETPGHLKPVPVLTGLWSVG